MKGKKSEGTEIGVGKRKAGEQERKKNKRGWWKNEKGERGGEELEKG